MKTSSFNKSVIQIMTGSGFSQIISVAASIAIARLYSAEQFGQFAVFVSTVAVILPILSWRYEQVVLMSKTEEEAKVASGLSLVMILLSSLLLILSVFALRNMVPAKVGLTAHQMLLVVPSAAIVSIASVFRFRLSRRTKFKIVSYGRVSNVIVRCLVQIVGGLINSASLFLVGGQLAGDSFELFLLFGAAKREVRELFAFDLKPITKCASKNWKQMVFNAPFSLFDSLAVQIPVFLLGFYYSSEVVGWYSFGNKLLNLPTALLGQSVGEVFFQRASKYYNEQEFRTKVLKLAGSLFLLGAAPALFLFFFSPFIFSIIFGEQWRTAGEYARIFAPMYLIRLCVTPLTSTLITVEKQHIYVVMMVTQFVFSVLPFAIYRNFSDPTSALKLSSALNILFYILYFSVVYHQVKRHDQRLYNARLEERLAAENQ